MKNGLTLLGIMLASVYSLAAQATVTATVNNTALSPGETIQLTLQRDSSADSQPDLAPLKNDFDVLGTSRGSNIQIINGHMSTQMQVTVLLSPRHDGKVQIPALNWGGEQSQPIDLSVAKTARGADQPGGNQAGSDNSHVFLNTSIDQKQPYVQAAVVLTVRLYADQSLLQASLDLPASNDVLVKPFGKDVQANEIRNGRNYQVVERKYLLFPQRSGKLKLDGPVLDAQIADNSASSNDPFDNIFRQMPFGGMVNGTKPIRVRGKAVELDVQPRPASANSAQWLPAQKVTLDETSDALQPQSITVHAGEPLTRHLKITALGLTGTQIPDPSTFMKVPDGIKAYPDQAAASEAAQGNSVLGTREQNIALIASQPGHYELPVVHLNWWDTRQHEMRELTLPAHSLDVLPAGAASTAVMPPVSLEPAPSEHSQPVPGNQAVNNPYWMWATFVFALLWLGTGVAWWRARNTIARPTVRNGAGTKSSKADKPAPIRSGTEFKAIRQACSNNDAQAARKHLLAWASTQWPDNPPMGINELSRRVDAEKFAEALRQLDRACYTGSEWQGELLAGVLPGDAVQEKQKGSKNLLPELYH